MTCSSGITVQNVLLMSRGGAQQADGGMGHNPGQEIGTSADCTSTQLQLRETTAGEDQLSEML